MATISTRVNAIVNDMVANKIEKITSTKLKEKSVIFDAKIDVSTTLL